jgi:pimeloyl-ACP methyl ester carboxylesterase
MRASFADIDGVRTRYLHAGNGDPLFLLHGVGVSGDVFVRNLDALGEEFAVYAPDMLGHGFTDAVDYRGGPPQPHIVRHLGRLADHLGLERYRVLGQSFGALIAALMYFDRPRQVTGLVLVGSGSVFHPPDEQAATLRAALANATTAMRDPTIETCRRRLQIICFDPASVPEEILLSQLTSYALPDRFPSYQATIAGLIGSVASPEHRVLSRLEDIGVPCLVVTGREDIRASWQRTEEGVGRIPDAELQIFERCGHLPFSEHPERFNDLVRRFLRETASKTAPGRN